MNYRQDNWPYELDCIRKGITGEEGYLTDISRHYTDDRLEMRGFDRTDIACAILTGIIVEGYSPEANRVRSSRSSGLVAPSRCILGRSLKGEWFIVVVGLVSTRNFHVITCTQTSYRHQQMIAKLENNLGEQ
ncbi:DUF4258 domain-containing protein (plasmid) [Paenibacillus rhizovicinus]|uniref:DUF4258 domain-containing protein n=1 Tax=Paenibacillus rhizovicinus TaxID=2704463 RepID=A0A6C0PCA8_9BACL|nr:DUF4258 domain-containing protein [Paenibacillus rhizovicinus]QHW35463.1 DUF4258 domain-containing protein [Paenibacillus rhizovicinus]